MNAGGEKDSSIYLSRYRRHYPAGPPQPTPERVPDPHFEDAVYIIKDAEDDTWSASWQGEFAELGEFVGAKDDAIAWAKQRSPRVWLHTEELGDYVLLDPEEVDESIRDRALMGADPPAAAAADASVAETRYRDYLGSPGPAAGGTGADQCGRPLAERVGGWFCYEPEPSALRDVSADPEREPHADGEGGDK